MSNHYCVGSPCPICGGADATPTFKHEREIRYGLSTGDLFNELVRRLNYDGNDTASLTLGEIARAVDGAKLPQ